MKRRTHPATGIAVFSGLLILAVAVLPMISDPTPPARAQQTQLASIEGVRGRSAPLADTSHIRVIDGDTLEDMTADITYRVENIDTPETGSRARCTAERDLGNRATGAVRALVAGAERLDLRPTGRIDRYGRTIALVVIDGRDLGETLIADGLARPWRGRREPWCDGAGNLVP
jgi:micrococcal nuclease